MPANPVALDARLDEFSLYLRAYWPDDAILIGDWAPPVRRAP
jgi:hypothetical protein